MNDSHNDSTMNGFFSGLIIGGLIGAVAALWLAPQSGDKTQKMIRKEAHRLKHTAEETVGDIKEGAENAADAVRQKVEDVRHDGEQMLNGSGSSSGSS